jgi:hypothetical protein
LNGPEARPDVADRRSATGTAGTSPDRSWKSGNEVAGGWAGAFAARVSSTTRRGSERERTPA